MRSWLFLVVLGAHEVRTVAQLRADLMGVPAGYNAPDRHTVARIAAWLANHTR